MAAALLLRREALDEVGLFDEGFFIYSEETDLCRRLRGAGWRTQYFPQVTVVHHESQFSAGIPERRINEMWRGRHRYWQKHHSAAGAARRRRLTGAQYAAALAAPRPRSRLRRADAPARARRAPRPRAGPARARGGLEPRARTHPAEHLAQKRTFGHTPFVQKRVLGGPMRVVQRTKSSRSETLRASRAHRPAHLAGGTWRSRVRHRPDPGGGAGGGRAAGVGAARPARRRRALDPHDLPRQPRRRRHRRGRGAGRRRSARAGSPGSNRRSSSST